MGNWDISYSYIRFFEDALSSHKQVGSFKREGDNIFHIERKEGKSPICALLVDIYTIGLSDVIQAMTDFKGITCIVTCGNWNAYTPHAKTYGLENGIGIFNSSEFFGALWWKQPNKYHRRDNDGNAIYTYRQP
jgi:hypothetical protein